MCASTVAFTSVRVCAAAVRYVVRGGGVGSGVGPIQVRVVLVSRSISPAIQTRSAAGVRRGFGACFVPRRFAPGSWVPPTCDSMAPASMVVPPGVVHGDISRNVGIPSERAKTSWRDASVSL